MRSLLRKNSPAASFSYARHPIFEQVMEAQHLTVGLILPLETHAGPAPTMADHLAMAQRADALGFAALWLRDVPFYDPRYGDVGQVFEPMVYMASLAMVTERIAIGTAGIVLPLREPKILAKQATSIDQLSGGRLLMGLSSGDRAAEYPLYGVDYGSRGDRFRDAFDVFQQVAEADFPTFESPRFGRSGGTHDLVPKPRHGVLAPWSGETRILMYPGFQFRVVDRLLTNFHLPQSTLLMLVSAFVGRERILAAYQHAIAQRYRFFSYGDAMLLARVDG